MALSGIGINDKTISLSTDGTNFTIDGEELVTFLVKINSEDTTSGYLSDKIDNNSIIIDTTNNVLKISDNYVTDDQLSLIIDDNSILSDKTWSSSKINSEFINIRSLSPILDLPVAANENTDVTITITNFIATAEYFFSTDAGKIEYSGGNTAILHTNEVDSDTSLSVYCYSVEIGKTKSNISTYTITVLDVPVEADGSINNTDFLTNESSNDGFQY